MFGSQVLEVGIGLIFFFLLLSLGFTALNELISALMGLRSKNLKTGIEQLLQDPGRIDALYRHPLMKSLSKNGKHPSYIPPKTFALSLLSTVAGTVTDCDELCRQLQSNPENPVSKQLLPLIESARGDIDRAIRNVEEWFNNTMDRVSGWYKRWTMLITFVSAAIVCMFLNADTIMVAKLLWSDAGLRAAVAGDAHFFAKGENALLLTTSTIDSAALTMAIAVDHLHQASFPIGWLSGNPGEVVSKMVRDLRTFPPSLTQNNTFGWWFFKSIGILFTILAVTLGAPFWFDLLSTVVKIRSSGARAAAPLNPPVN